MKRYSPLIPLFQVCIILSGLFAPAAECSAQDGEGITSYKCDSAYTVAGVTFRMKYVGGGTFRMGVPLGQDVDSYENESPFHDVTLDDFYIGETEVTQGLWKAVMGNNPSYSKGDGLPVQNVSWDDCRAFIDKLNDLTGMRFRFPTEAEWEYAAQGGAHCSVYRFSGSADPDDVAWYAGNSGGTVHPVMSKAPNVLGIYDMSGNVVEWCSDRYGEYTGMPQNNPWGASSGQYRVGRGGSFKSPARDCRVSQRDFDFPTSRDFFVGLRLACSSASPELWCDESAPTADRVEDLLSRLSVDEKISLLTETAPEIERFGIKKYYHGNEALHGIVRPGRFTVFPQAIGMASMWDPELHHRISSAASDEARARWNELGEGDAQKELYSDLLTFWSPTVNMARDPRWGRTPETYGEDPFLSGVLGAAFVTGLQGDDPRYLKVVSTPKHFACNNEEHNRAECNVSVSEKQLREYYLAPYEACVKNGHAASIMASYNAINGVPSCCNGWLLTDVLRGDWGFDGYVVSDCGGVQQIQTHQKYVDDPVSAASLALKAGLDLECGHNYYIEPLRQAYLQGTVTDEDIDRAAGRVLTARMRLGLFDSGDANPYTKLAPSVVGCQEHLDIALQAARESIVLLKNAGGFLPLDPSGIRSIALVGNNAANSELGDYSGTPTIEPKSVLKALTERLGGQVKINYVPWRTPQDETDYVGAEYFPKGIVAHYYDGMDFTVLRAKRKETDISYDPAGRAPDPQVPDMNMSARWTGKLVPDVTGIYTFRLDLKGEASFWLDGKLLIENSSDKEVSLPLEAAKEYDLRIDFRHHRDSGPLMKLRWKKPQASGDYWRQARKAAVESDVVIAVMGINKNYEREGKDRDYLTLPPDQIEFLKTIYKSNKKIVLVLVAGSSMAVTWEDAHLPAIVDSWYGGEFGGPALVDVLFGDYNPAGRLPLTFYRSEDQLPPFDDYDLSKGRTYRYFTGKPLYPFGHGLSYTTFEYSDLSVKDAGDALSVTFSLKNTGTRDGDEVAQVYVRLKDYESEAPLKELKGFQRVNLKRGESRKITVSIPKDQLRYWSESRHCFVTTSLTPEIMVGASSSDIRLRL